MVTPLALRFGEPDDDTIASFERAAAARFRDATILRRADRRLAAIYLYGYSVEMWIKAASFRSLFHATGRPIDTRLDRAERKLATREYPKAAGSKGARTNTT